MPLSLYHRYVVQFKIRCFHAVFNLLHTEHCLTLLRWLIRRWLIRRWLMHSFISLQLEIGTSPLSAATPGQARAPILSNALNTASMGQKLHRDLGRETFLSSLPPKSIFNVVHVTTRHAPQWSATVNAALRSVHHTTFIRAILLGLTFVAGLVMAFCAASRYKLLPETGLRANNHETDVGHGSYQSCVSKQHDWPQMSSGFLGDHQQCMDVSLYHVGVVADSNEVWPDTIAESHC